MDLKFLQLMHRLWFEIIEAFNLYSLSMDHMRFYFCSAVDVSRPQHPFHLDIEPL
jgi:hypothetical protein